MKINEELLRKLAKQGTAFVLAGSLLAGSNTIILETNMKKFNTVSAQTVSDEAETVDLDVQVGINLYMDDKGFVPRDVNGQETYPFISDGTTYVPIRAVASLFNADIKWDAKTNSVYINTKGKKSDLNHTILEKQDLINTSIRATKGANLYINNNLIVPTDVNGNIKDIYVVNGTTYVPVRAVSNALQIPITWSSQTNSVFIGKHKTNGLTVENINEVNAFKEVVDDYYHGYSGFYGGEKITDDYMIDHIFLSAWVAHYFMACMLNKEYISDDSYKDIFAGRSEISFINLACVYLAMIEETYNIPDNEMEEVFDWKSVVIDQDYAQFLTDFQHYAYQGYLTSEYNELRELIDEYLFGTKDGLHLNCNDLIDIIVLRASLMLKIYDNSSREYGYCYDLYFDKKALVEKEIERVSFLVCNKELVKTK